MTTVIFNPPMVKASSRAIEKFTLTNRVRSFLTQIGLPSNALYFLNKKKRSAIMSFDSLCHPRYIHNSDITDILQAVIEHLRNLIIIGIYGCFYICISEQKNEEIYLIDSNPLKVEDYIEYSVLFMNTDVEKLSKCLYLYKKFTIHCSKKDYSSIDFRIEFLSLEKDLLSIDSAIFSRSNSYWLSIVEELDIW